MRDDLLSMSGRRNDHGKANRNQGEEEARSHRDFFFEEGVDKTGESGLPAKLYDQIRERGKATRRIAGDTGASSTKVHVCKNIA